MYTENSGSKSALLKKSGYNTRQGNQFFFLKKKE
jgi:hypothetical protein